MLHFHIINAIILNTLASEWKSANVVPVHKKGDKSSVENYGPISLTYLVMKTFDICTKDEIRLRYSDLKHHAQYKLFPLSNIYHFP